MSDARSEYETRKRLLQLLSDLELADVNNAATAAGLARGDEFLDLRSLSHGVQRAPSAAQEPGYVLPRKVVREVTWSRLLTIVDREYPRLMRPGAVR